MIYSGKTLSVLLLPSGTAHLVFNLDGSSVNKFNQATLLELQDAVRAVGESTARGIILSSGKSTFIVGADIGEFTLMFEQSEQQIHEWLVVSNAIFNAIEDLAIPSVTAINGTALGGGFEVAIATDYRVAAASAVVGFPEVKLGILPGFGGTVRLPRLIGADNANQWISSGAHIKAEQAFKEGAVDAIVPQESLIQAAEHMIAQCVAGKLNYKQVRLRKKSPLLLQPIELNVAFETAKGVVSAQAGPHYPAPIGAVAVMQKAATKGRDDALLIEHQGFVKLAKTEVAKNLVQMFLNDQFLGGKAKQYFAGAKPVNAAAVLGAGIMGGGIAYQSAITGTRIIMKDVNQTGLDVGQREIRKLLDKAVIKGKLDQNGMITALSSINPALDYHGFDKVDFIVEAVIENLGIKKTVLAEVEAKAAPDTILASNTSTISIDDLAVALKRPENFCGMHFFNPVPVMPLVEIIRGKASSKDTISTAVAYAKKLGKTPIVVNNCPGFLVNRILFPYFGAFSRLLHDGADFRQIDKAMERFGWPMGPAYLLDVVGIDTAVHAQAVMAAGFKRMQLEFTSAIDKLYASKTIGQKSGSGFYLYKPDKQGKPKKLPNPDVDALIATIQPEKRPFSDEEIVERMMLAMCLETARCLEDNIVDTAIEADMGLVLGIGFPAFRGGALRYMDSIGLSQVLALCDKYGKLGPLYQATESILAMNKSGQKFYGSTRVSK